MEKWDYLFLKAEYADGYRLRWVNRQENADWKHGAFLDDHIQILAGQGWDLVAHLFSSNADQQGKIAWERSFAVMKRVKV